jgi:hypothetical protein
MRARVRAICLVAWLTALLVVSGCAAPPAPTPSPGPTPAPSPGAPGTALPRPGLQTQADGTALAFGWVVRMDIEGGFWALTDADPTAGAAGGTVVVLLPGKVAETSIAALAGKYVRATGTQGSDASIRMAGPEMTVDSIEELAPNR